MKVLITGSSEGIGLETAVKFLNAGHEVYGFDVKSSNVNNAIFKFRYHHYFVDVRDKDNFPNFDFNFDIIINNAGVQNSGDDINVNLVGAINITEKYAFQPDIKSVLFNASASAHTGFEFPEYSASKAGLIGYMKNCAWRLAKYGATCNSISCGGVLTDLNKPVMEDKKLWKKIMDITPLKKWATAKEIAEWIYFITVVNKSASGIDILIDNCEHGNSTFIWPE